MVKSKIIVLLQLYEQEGTNTTGEGENNFLSDKKQNGKNKNHLHVTANPVKNFMIKFQIPVNLICSTLTTTPK